MRYTSIPSILRPTAATNRYRIVAVTNNFGHSVAGIPQGELEFLGWDKGEGSSSPALRGLFDDYIDSSEVGLRSVRSKRISHQLSDNTSNNRKPDPEIYSLACERNAVRPEEVVMLDDLGMYVLGPRFSHKGTQSTQRNLKSAQGLGITTIRECRLGSK